MQWFRFYNEALNDPKVQTLPDNIFKFWVNCLCLASQNDGLLPPTESIEFALRCNKESVTSALQTLKKLGLIDEKHGKLFPHNWSKRQFKSDTSAERVKRHRKRKCNVTVTPPDTESDTEQNRADITPLIPLKGKEDKSIFLDVFMVAKFPDDPKDLPEEWGNEAEAIAREMSPMTNINLPKNIIECWKEFYDYWNSNRTAKMKKTDWQATFRNRWRDKFAKLSQQEKRDELYQEKLTRYSK